MRRIDNDIRKLFNYGAVVLSILFMVVMVVGAFASATPVEHVLVLILGGLAMIWILTGVIAGVYAVVKKSGASN